jgi:PPP family 3-phenylpropionic acid transporter
MSAFLRISFFYAALFLGLSDAFAFFPVWYAGRGLDGQWIGYALGAGALARFVMGPLIAARASHASHMPNILRVASAAVLLLFLLHIPITHPVVFVLLGLALGTAYAPMMPVADSFSMALERRKLVHYGPVRSAGSAAFIIGTLIVGQLIEKNTEIMLYWAIGSGVLLVIASWMLPKVEAKVEASPEKARTRLKDALLFFARPHIAVALTVTFLVQASHAFYYGFSALVWTSAGLTTGIIGVLFAWGVLFEVVVFNVSPWFRKLLSPQIMLLIGASAALIRWLALSTQPELGALFGWQILNGFSVAMTNLGMMAYLQAQAPERLLAGVQSVNSSIAAGLALAIGFSISGTLYAKIGADGYLFAAGVAAISLLLCVSLVAFQLRGTPHKR